MKRIVAPFLLCLSIACAHQPNPGPCVESSSEAQVSSQARESTEGSADIEQIAARFVDRLNAQDAKGVFEMFNSNMQQAVPLAATEKFVAGVAEAKGRITGSTLNKAGKRSASFLLKADRGEWLLSLALDDAGKLAGMKMAEPPAPPPAVARNEVSIGLPFKDRWTVVWGGDNYEVNKHVEHKSQRRAADLVMVGPDGKTHRSDGKKNDDYLAYGRQVLSVADGTVVTAIDGVPDNHPGAMNPYFAPGNAVIIKHAENLYSVYAHLKPGSLQVKPGTSVRRGQVIGLCGNSGNSSEAHLHFQLQDGPLFESAWGVEAVFQGTRLTRGGETAKASDYRFSKGDVVEPE